MNDTQLSNREQKAAEIAAFAKLTRKGDTVWIVASQSSSKNYTVNLDPESPRCTCPDFESRQARCKHIYAVEIALKAEGANERQTETATETATVKRATYRQQWPEYNKA